MIAVAGVMISVAAIVRAIAMVVPAPLNGRGEIIIAGAVGGIVIVIVISIMP